MDLKSKKAQRICLVTILFLGVFGFAGRAHAAELPSNIDSLVRDDSNYQISKTATPAQISAAQTIGAYVMANPTQNLPNLAGGVQVGVGPYGSKVIKYNLNTPQTAEIQKTIQENSDKVAKLQTEFEKSDPEDDPALQAQQQQLIQNINNAAAAQVGALYLEDLVPNRNSQDLPLLYLTETNYTKALQDVNNYKGNTTAVAANQKKIDTLGAQATKAASSPIQCFAWTGTISFTFDPMGCAALAGYVMLQAASFLLMIVATVFDYTIDYTLNFKDFLNKANIITLGWTSFRDIVNLFFIFILVYIGIGTIINSGTYNAKSLLAKVLIGAALLNFSLFFTEAMIDVSNIFSLQFYYKIIQGANAASLTTGSVAVQGSTVTATDSGISAGIANALGLTDLFTIGANSTTGLSTTPTLGYASLTPTTLLLYSLGSTVFVLVTAFVLGAAAWMFLWRALTLVFLMVLSPVAFAGQLLPSTKSHVAKWWTALWNNLIFAPVYMALMYVVLSVVFSQTAAAATAGQHTSFLDVFKGGADAPAIVLNFFILIGLMCGCLLVATSFSATGANAATNLGKRWGKAAAAYPARSVVGNLAHGLANDGRLSSLAATRVGRLFGAGALLRGADNLTKFKFNGKSYADKIKEKEDARNRTIELVEKPANVFRKKGESDADYDKRVSAAKSAGKARGDNVAGIKVDANGKVTRNSVGGTFAGGIAASSVSAARAKSRSSESKTKTNEKKSKEKTDADIEKYEKALATGPAPAGDPDFGAVVRDAAEAREKLNPATAGVVSIDTKIRALETASSSTTNPLKLLSIEAQIARLKEDKKEANAAIKEEKDIKDKLAEARIRKSELDAK